MDYNTKFNLGQRVWLIQRDSARRLVRCRLCKSTGKVTFPPNETDEFVCPKCDGRSAHYEWAGDRFYVDYQVGEVGQVRIEHTDPSYLYRDEKDAGPEITYMLSTHGVRSGSVLTESDLFASEEEANAEVIRRNQGKEFTCEDGAEMLPPLTGAAEPRQSR